MLKKAFLILLVLLISIVGGSASVWWALRANEGWGALRIGRWTAFPSLGTADVDFYSKARVSREGSLVLGRAEGLSFSAERDSDGASLLRHCSYIVEGPVPQARFWTFYAADRSGALVKGGDRRSAAIHSYQLTREPDNSILISVGKHPAPGNWLALSGSGPMKLVLTLFDTPIASGGGASDVLLPTITRVGCDD